MTHTDEQNKIFNFVQYDSNHGIIDAVAGSGKTTTIVESVGFIDPSKRVLFCAFNNSIAKEIASRFFHKGMNGGNNSNFNFASLNQSQIFYWNGEATNSQSQGTRK
jgi:hypothetical protein